MSLSCKPNTNDPDPLDQAIADLLVFSVWELRQAANRAFERLDLTSFEVTALNLVAREPHLRPSDLSRRLEMIPGRISVMLAHLEERGLLARTTPQADQRSRNVSLTKAGERLRLEANRVWREVTLNRYGEISHSDKKALLRVLQLIHAGASQN